MTELLHHPTRHLFFTGKGGVGKTSLACSTAIALADSGKRVLLVSTDPASNLDEVLGVPLHAHPTPIASVPGLEALNIDPEEAARAYRERVVGPYRGKLPDAAVASIEEQLSGACTVEIAAFDEFVKLLGNATGGYDHVVFDTAPTGHTLRLLSLPAAWTGYLQANPGAASCLGPLGGLQAQRSLYEAAMRALADSEATTLVLVTRPEPSALKEAERTRGELTALGVCNQRLIINGVFTATARDDRVALALDARGRAALQAMPAGLEKLEATRIPLSPSSLVGVAALRRFQSGAGEPIATSVTAHADPAAFPNLLAELERPGKGVIMTMGKGGVGKTTLAVAIATGLLQRGHQVHLTTTDPAGRFAGLPGLRVSRIDPAAETVAYMDEVRALTAAGLDQDGRALLEEDLRSPCTEEIAVFRAFARTVATGENEFVVVDTAPTGHTLLLLDATETYHREVSRGLGNAPDAVSRLLPRLRDPDFTRVLIVTLPDATPVHEAMRLDADLRRADIRPFAWVVNQCFAPLTTIDPVLSARAAHELPFLAEVRRATDRCVVLPWTESPTTSTQWF